MVRAFKTTKDLAARARRSLRDVGAHLIGTVLNDLDHSRTGYGYSSYYGYQSYKSEAASEAESA